LYVASKKRHIPRGYRNQYIPGWNVRCDELYEEYNSSHRSETAANLLEELNEQRKKKWEKTIEAANFTHSSRKAWKMLKKLGTDAIPASRQKSITANGIASRLLRVSKTQRDREHVRTTKMNLRRKKRTLTVNQTLSRESCWI
jgi:hypothetical protein